MKDYVYADTRYTTYFTKYVCKLCISHMKWVYAAISDVGAIYFSFQTYTCVQPAKKKDLSATKVSFILCSNVKTQIK